MTRNTVQRLLVFFIGVPLFIAATIYASFGRNILLALLVAIIQVLGVRESAGLFAAKKWRLNIAYLSFLSVASTAFVYFSPFFERWIPSGPSSLEILLASTIIGALAVLAPFAFTRAEGFADILPKIAASLFVFFYCGVLGSFLTYITSCFGQGTAPVLVFTLMTFGNDSLAWLVGITLGKKRGIIAVSPNKSAAGFIGGLTGSMIAGAFSFLLFPGSNFRSLLFPVSLGAALGCSVILGDLVESALKRSAGVKDSSSLVPGRGGVLDSFDSLLYSAPIFVLISTFLRFFPPLA